MTASTNDDFWIDSLDPDERPIRDTDAAPASDVLPSPEQFGSTWTSLPTEPSLSQWSPDWAERMKADRQEWLALMRTGGAPASSGADSFPFTAPPSPPGYPAQLAGIAEIPGIRANANRVYAALDAASTPPQYRGAARAILAELAGAANAPRVHVEKAWRKATEGENYLLPEVRRDNATEQYAEGREASDKHLSEAAKALDALESKLIDDARVVRPAGISDAAEQSMKADLTMRLSGVAADQLEDTMIDLLDTAVATHDETVTWLLGQSQWAVWYLQSRGLDTFAFAEFEKHRVEVVPPSDQRRDALAMREGLFADVRAVHTQVSQILSGLRSVDDDQLAGWLRANVA